MLSNVLTFSRTVLRGFFLNCCALSPLPPLLFVGLQPRGERFSLHHNQKKCSFYFFLWLQVSFQLTVFFPSSGFVVFVVVLALVRVGTTKPCREGKSPLFFIMAWLIQKKHKTYLSRRHACVTRPTTKNKDSTQTFCFTSLCVLMSCLVSPSFFPLLNKRTTVVCSPLDTLQPAHFFSFLLLFTCETLF